MTRWQKVIIVWGALALALALGNLGWSLYNVGWITGYNRCDQQRSR